MGRKGFPGIGQIIIMKIKKGYYKKEYDFFD